MFSKVTVFAICAIGALALGYEVHSGSRSKRQETAHEAKPREEDTSRFRELEARVRALEAAPAPEVFNVSSGAPAPESNQVGPSGNDLASAAEGERAGLLRQRELNEERRQWLDAALEAEGIDFEWATEMENQLASVFAGQEFGGSDVTETVCKGNLCRVQVQHETISAMQDFPGGLMSSGLAHKHAFWGLENVTDDGQASILYVAREGQSARLDPVREGATSSPMRPN